MVVVMVGLSVKSFGEWHPFYTYGLNKHLAIAATGLVGVGLNLHHPTARAGVILHQPSNCSNLQLLIAATGLAGVGLNLHHPAAWLV